MKETKKRALPFFGIDCLLIGKKKMAFLQYTISNVNALPFLGIFSICFRHGKDCDLGMERWSLN